MTKVSIILPIYNVARYLPKCIDSVISQTLTDIEIILATDGPEDCDAICEAYAQKDKRVKIISHAGGYGKSVNKGIDVATGEYIGIVETDDYCDLTMFEKLYEAAKAQDADVVKSGFWTLYNEKNKNHRMKVTSLPQLLNNKQKYELLISFQPSVWSAIYRRDFLKKCNIRFMEEKYSFIDTPFYMATLLLSEKYFLLPQELYFYNVDNPEQSIKSKEKVIDGIKVEEFAYQWFCANIIPKKENMEYFVHMTTSNLKWHFERLKSEENKKYFFKLAHPYVKQLGLDYLHALSTNLELIDFIKFLYQSDDFDTYYRQSYSEKLYKICHIPVLKIIKFRHKFLKVYLFSKILFLNEKVKNNIARYKLFNLIPICKRKVL